MSEISKLNDGRIHCLVIGAKMNQNEAEAFERRKLFDHVIDGLKGGLVSRSVVEYGSSTC